METSLTTAAIYSVMIDVHGGKGPAKGTCSSYVHNTSETCFLAAASLRSQALILSPLCFRYKRLGNACEP